jgi:hypothetical protein
MFVDQPFHGVRTSVENAVIKADVEIFRFHNLRRTAISNMIMTGVPLQAIGEIAATRRRPWQNVTPAWRRPHNKDRGDSPPIGSYVSQKCPKRKNRVRPEMAITLK